MYFPQPYVPHGYLGYSLRTKKFLTKYYLSPWWKAHNRVRKITFKSVCACIRKPFARALNSIREWANEN